MQQASCAWLVSMGGIVEARLIWGTLDAICIPPHARHKVPGVTMRYAARRLRMTAEQLHGLCCLSLLTLGRGRHEHDQKQARRAARDRAVRIGDHLAGQYECLQLGG